MKFSRFELLALCVAFCGLGSSAFAAVASGPIPEIDTVSGFLSVPPTYVSMLIPAIAELIMRLWPTNKAAGILHSVSLACGQIAKFFASLASFSDKVLPQNAADPVAPVA